MFALCTTEVDYVVVTEMGKEMLWVEMFLHELGLKEEGDMVQCDSMVATDLSKNVIYHSHNEHIEVPYFECLRN